MAPQVVKPRPSFFLRAGGQVPAPTRPTMIGPQVGFVKKRDGSFGISLGVIAIFTWEFQTFLHRLASVKISLPIRIMFPKKLVSLVKIGKLALTVHLFLMAPSPMALVAL
jgi:hypothetical protein